MTYTVSLGYTPDFRISYNGADVTSAFVDRVVEIKVITSDGSGQSDRLVIVLDDRDAVIALPDTTGKATLQLSLGYVQSGLADQGTFQIWEATCLGPARSMRLAGTSSGVVSNLKSQVVIAHDNKTIQQIVDGIAASAGMVASVDASLANIQIPFLNQFNSNQHLLTYLERNFNAISNFNNNTLSLTPRGSISGSFSFTPEDLASWQVKTSQRTVYSSVQAHYWDKVQHERVWVNSTVPPVPGASVPFTLNAQHNSQAEAQAAADATMAAGNRGYMTGSIALAKGDPSIRGGSQITISGMRDGVDGSYIAGTVTHIYRKDSGILTTVDLYGAPTG